MTCYKVKVNALCSLFKCADFTIQFNSSIYSDTLVPYKTNKHMNIDTRSKSNSTHSFKGIHHIKPGSCSTYKFNHRFNFIPIKIGIDHCCSLILSSDSNKAAWLLSSLVRSFLSASNLSAYFRFIDISELQIWALRANTYETWTLIIAAVHAPKNSILIFRFPYNHESYLCDVNAYF